MGPRIEDVPIASGEDPPPRGKAKRPAINLTPIIFLSLQSTGKVADNQKNQIERYGISDSTKNIYLPVS